MLLLLPISAGDHQDIALSIGHQTYRWPEEGISFSYGISLGISSRIEVSIWGYSELVPHPFASNMLGADFSFGHVGFSAELRTEFPEKTGNYINVPAIDTSEPSVSMTIKTRLVF